MLKVTAIAKKVLAVLLALRLVIKLKTAGQNSPSVLLMYYMNPFLYPLKLKIQGLGPLRPEAWEMICRLAHCSKISERRSFVRKTGTLAYLAEGVLKEYDPSERALPSIINFISGNQCFVTERHHLNYYLKSCTPCMIYTWDMATLNQIYQYFNEMRPVYEGICAQYELKLMLRMRLLEMPVQERIDIFKIHFKAELPYLKKKDIANYLHISYTNLLAKF